MARARPKRSEKRVIKKIDVLSLAKIEGVIFAVIGFVIGLSVSLFSLSLGSYMMGGAGYGFAFGAFSIIVLPIVWGIFGFVTGAITAFVYNVIADHIGGLEIEVGR